MKEYYYAELQTAAGMAGCCGELLACATVKAQSRCYHKTRALKSVGSHSVGCVLHLIKKNSSTPTPVLLPYYANAWQKEENTPASNADMI